MRVFVVEYLLSSGSRHTISYIADSCQDAKGKAEAESFYVTGVWEWIA